MFLPFSRFFLTVVLALFIVATSARAEGTPFRVVASIKPIHSLVAAVMGDVGSPDLLVKGSGSPHAYSLRPSDATHLQHARVIFWTGPELETFLTRPLATLGSQARTVALGRIDGDRTTATDQHHEDHHDHEDAHHHDGKDPHVWLDPVAAQRMVDDIAHALSQADPVNAATYAANADVYMAMLDELIKETERLLEPVRNTPYIVFHDAYGHFEGRFGLTSVGAITISPGTRPSAQRITSIRDTILRTKAVCVFAEPQFSPALVETVTQGTSARTGSLDPLGATLTEGPDLYGLLIRSLAQSFLDCLAPGDAVRN